VYEIEIHKGSQWALFMPTLVVVYVYNGDPCKQSLFPIEIIGWDDMKCN